MIINIPNFITLGRIISVPVIFWLLLSGQSTIAFIVFVCAGRELPVSPPESG